MISFDETDAYMLASIPITIVKQPLEKISVKAVKLLKDLLSRIEKNTEHISIELETEIILRSSCK